MKTPAGWYDGRCTDGLKPYKSHERNHTKESAKSNCFVSTYIYQIEKSLVDMGASIDQVTLIKDRETGSSLTRPTRSLCSTTNPLIYLLTNFFNP